MRGRCHRNFDYYYISERYEKKKVLRRLGGGGGGGGEGEGTKILFLRENCVGNLDL